MGEVPFAKDMGKTKTGRLSDEVSRLKTNDGRAHGWRDVFNL